MRKRAALMSRVSSDEQAKGYSLGVQSEALENYCLRNDIEIVYSFREDHSAKSFERPEFKKFLEYLKKNSKEHRPCCCSHLGIGFPAMPWMRIT
jgi:site-specific DNA recombinase